MQIQVFEENKLEDDDNMVSAEGFDLNDHHQVTSKKSQQLGQQLNSKILKSEIF